MLNIFKHFMNTNRPIQIAGLIREDEMKDLEKYIEILNSVFVDMITIDKKMMPRYRITINSKDKELLQKIMRDTFDNNYNIRK